MDKATIYQAMAMGLNAPDERSMGVYKMLMDVYPAFSKKLFERNELMNHLVMTGNNPMDILEYPICGSCETLALWNGVIKQGDRYYNKCTCIASGCGHTTIRPITLREWIHMELKKKAPKEFIEAIEFCVDGIASQMVQKHKMELRDIFMARNHGKKQELIVPEQEESVIIQHNTAVDDIDFNTEE